MSKVVSIAFLDSHTNIYSNKNKVKLVNPNISLAYPYLLILLGLQQLDLIISL